MKWSPMGENAVLVWCQNEAASAELAQSARSADWPWLIDVVQSYSSVAVYFRREPAMTPTNIISQLRALPRRNSASMPRHRHVVPVCYERGLDLGRIVEHAGLDRDATIQLHTNRVYTVYAIGFCPGFPYLGYVTEEIANVPRLPSPRLRVPAGSVGLTGRQTGIYTEERPGGWNIVGQTPLELVNVADVYFPLRTGDEVEFVRIDERDFANWAGERLPTRRT